LRGKYEIYLNTLVVVTRNYQTMVKLPVFNDTEYVMRQLLVKVIIS